MGRGRELVGTEGGWWSFIIIYSTGLIPFHGFRPRPKGHKIIFQILYIIVGPLQYPASIKCFVFYKVPPSDKCSLLWLANWPRALWMSEHHKHESEM